MKPVVDGANQQLNILWISMLTFMCESSEHAVAVKLDFSTLRGASGVFFHICVPEKSCSTTVVSKQENSYLEHIKCKLCQTLPKTTQNELRIRTNEEPKLMCCRRTDC